MTANSLHTNMGKYPVTLGMLLLKFFVHKNSMARFWKESWNSEEKETLNNVDLPHDDDNDLLLFTFIFIFFMDHSVVITLSLSLEVYCTISISLKERSQCYSLWRLFSLTPHILSS